jgi:hypothetical protein
VNRFLACATATVFVAVSAFFSAGTPPAGRPELNITLTGSHESTGTHRFDIRASSVRGLYPGAKRQIDLAFANSNPFPLRVASIKGELTSSSKRGCRPVPTNLIVTPYGGRLPLTIPSQGRVNAGHLDVRMPNTVVEACQRATFTVRIIGYATKASR